MDNEQYTIEWSFLFEIQKLRPKEENSYKANQSYLPYPVIV